MKPAWKHAQSQQIAMVIPKAGDTTEIPPKL